MPAGRTLLAALLCLLLAAPAPADTSIPITGDRLSGFVLPIEPLAADLRFEALKAWAWDVDDTRRLVLRGDVEVRIGAREFHGPSAVVWLNRVPSAEGLINQVAVFFEEVGNPSRRAGLGAEGRYLLLTASTRGAVSLSAADVVPRQPRQVSLLRLGESRLAEYLRRLRRDIEQDEVVLEALPQYTVPPPPEEFVPVPGGTVTPEDEDLPERVVLPAEDQRLPLLAPRGMVRFSAGRLDFRRDEIENVAMLRGGLVVEYVTAEGHEDWSQLTLTAQRGVIFTAPGRSDELARGEIGAEVIRGIYLEGNVHITAAEGDYVARSPRVYYDFATGEAIMLDAVLRTYARDSDVPIYARALEMRQVAANQWAAEKVRVSTSAFFTPHLSLGADRAIVTRRPVAADPRRRETHVTSTGNTLYSGHVPLVGWPRFSGTVREPPLTGIRIGSQTNDGVIILTRWDLHTLLGREAPDGHEATLRLDGFTRRGGGGGLEYAYRGDDAAGALDLYGMYDDGTDITSSGGEVRRDGDLRGVVLWEHDQRLHPRWRLQAQLSFISDETFISARREEDFLDRREYETSAYLHYLEGNSSLSVLGAFALNDFLSNDYLLASRGYTVDRLPEIAYRRAADRVFDAFNWSSDTRLGRMALVFQDSTPAEIGVPAAAFGVAANTSIADGLRAQGLREGWISRFDTRHEISAPGSWGALEITPFAVARYTAYSDDFEEFNGEDDLARLYGSVGVRLDTQFQHVDNDVRSGLLDLNRMRHIVEPSAVLWAAASDFDLGELPVYDEDVEGIGDGLAVRAGVRNTWQTQRGGPGRWRSVDWLTIDTNVVLTDETTRRSPTPQFFDWRPEQSSFGNHASATQLLLLSDSVSLVGSQVYDFQGDVFARASVGAEVNHSPDFRTFVEFRYLDAGRNELLGVEWDYRLSRRYRVRLRPQWDFRENDFRALDLQLTRSFPDYDVVFSLSRDEIRDVTSFGASLRLAEF